ncbi:MAG: hypothetical protein Q7J48_20575 [Nocardioides sp.]|nr:hypothetical protein [Nocardioides sp.]
MSRSKHQVESPWARHYQDVWHERSGDHNLPKWLRVTCLAYGAHQNNGHANFKRGEVALVLATIDTETGAIYPLDRRDVFRAIRQAVAFGWLEEGSTARCLIVPAHAVKKGPLGDETKPCPIHVRRGR